MTPFTRLVSIIVPTFNHGAFISETLSSVLEQKYDHWECIIVNDGSTDNTEDICRSFQKQDARFQYFFKENNGLATTRNQGLKMAKGDFIQLLDSDDLLAPDKLKNQLDVFQNYPQCDIVYSGYACFYDGHFNEQWTYSRVELKNDTMRDFVLNWERGLSIPIHCFMYRKSCFERWGRFDERFSRGKEDWDIHIRFALHGARFHFLPGATAYYRVHHDGSMARNRSDARRFKKILLKKYMFSRELDFPLRSIFIKRYLREIFYPSSR